VKVLIGPSGAGKSTLLQCLNLLVMPDAGRIWLEGREVDRSRRKGLHGYRRQVGIIFLVGDLLPFRGVARAGALLLAPDSEKRARLWDVRKEVSLRIKGKNPVYIPEDVVVPVAGIAEFVGRIPEFERRFEIAIHAFGHAGDGNIHLNLTARSESDRPRVEAAIGELLRLVLAMGGTISGEHGIGAVKREVFHPDHDHHFRGLEPRNS